MMHIRRTTQVCPIAPQQSSSLLRCFHAHVVVLALRDVVLSLPASPTACLDQQVGRALACCMIQHSLGQVNKSSAVVCTARWATGLSCPACRSTTAWQDGHCQVSKGGPANGPSGAVLVLQTLTAAASAADPHTR